MPDTYQPQLTNSDSTLAGRIRAVADLAEATWPDYRRIQLDLWCLCIDARTQADTLDARLIDSLCKLQTQTKEGI